MVEKRSYAPDTPSGPPRRAALHTLGCRLNQAESLLLRDHLQAAGYRLVNWDEPAELGILHTCTVTREAEAKCRKALRGFIGRNPAAFTAVIGCYAQTGAAELAAIPGLDLIVGNQEKLLVLDYVGLGKNPHPVILRERIDPADFSIRFYGEAPYDQRANLKVQDGCDFFCSFCIIPTARGRARSREWDNCLAEAHQLVERGVRELVLTGVNIGTYQSAGHGIVGLVDALNAIPALERIRISSIEPTTVPLALIERMADPAHRLVPYLHLPLQSGSDRVLALMRRKYTTAAYASFVEAALALCPELGLGTDILVGMTGESAADFAQTCDFFHALPFSYAHVFPYSERPGTLTLKRAEQAPAEVVPVPERQRRVAQLRRLSASQHHDWMARHLGQTVEVLLENPHEGAFPGYTGNYLRVRAQTPAQWGDVRNRRALVRLETLHADFMEGPAVELLDADSGPLPEPIALSAT